MNYEQAALPNLDDEEFLDIFVFEGTKFNDPSSKLGQTKLSVNEILRGDSRIESLYKDGDLIGELKFDITRD